VPRAQPAQPPSNLHTPSAAQSPVALRLAYHDAGTFSKLAGDGGLNASIRFELDRPENFGLKRGWRLIEQVGALCVGRGAAGGARDGGEQTPHPAADCRGQAAAPASEPGALRRSPARPPAAPAAARPRTS
jgi:L-ascorbate peroxidase